MMCKDKSANGIILKILDYIRYNSIQIPKCIIDIGASEGIYTSNSYHLLNNEGWEGFLFEPIYVQYKKLFDLYKGCFDKVRIFNLAVSNFTGRTILYNHPNDGSGNATGNHGASLVPYWGKSTKTWNVYSISGAALCKLINMNEVGILSIDTEGHDYVILDSILSNNENEDPCIIISEVWHKRHKENEKEFFAKYNYKKLDISNKNDSVYLRKNIGE